MKARAAILRLLMTWATVAVCLGGALSATTAWAADWYVATTGNDGNAGTEVAPFLTIAHAVGVAADDDTIHVAAGTYVIASAIEVDKRLTIRGAQAGNSARSDEPSPRNPAGAGETILDAEANVIVVFDIQSDHVVIDGFSITGSAYLTPIRTDGVASRAHVEVANNFVIRDSSAASTFGITLDKVSNAQILSNALNGFRGDADEGAIRLKYSDDGLVYGNEIVNSDYAGVHQTAISATYATNSVIERNWVHSWAGKSGVFLRHGTGATLRDNQIDDFYQAGMAIRFPNVLVEGNVITGGVPQNDMRSPIWIRDAACSNIVVRYNKIFDTDIGGSGTAGARNAAVTLNSVAPSAAASIVVQNNRLFNNFDSYVGREAASGFCTQIADAENFPDVRNNWWGHSEGPATSTEYPEPPDGYYTDPNGYQTTPGGEGDAAGREDHEDPAAQFLFGPWALFQGVRTNVTLAGGEFGVGTDRILAGDTGRYTNHTVNIPGLSAESALMIQSPAARLTHAAVRDVPSAAEFMLDPEVAITDGVPTVTIEFKDTEIPAGKAAADMRLVRWNASAGAWQLVPGSTVNTETRQVGATVAELGVYGAMAESEITYFPPVDPSTIPWHEPFADTVYWDGRPVHGIHGWSAPASVMASDEQSLSAPLSMKIPETAAATNVFDGTTAGFVWTDLWAQPLMGDIDTPELNGNEAVAFYFNDDGWPVTYNGTTASWQTNTSVDAISPGEWTRVTIFQNFTEQRWYLFVNGTLAARDLGFARTVKTYNGFSLDHVTEEDEGYAAYFDDMWVHSVKPDGGTDNANDALDSYESGRIMEDAWQLHYFGNLRQSDFGDYDGDGFLNAREFLLGSDPTDPDDPGGAIAVLPYRQGFESAAFGAFPTNGWQGLTANGTVTAQASQKIELNRALRIENDEGFASITLTVSDTDAKQVWTLLYVRPAYQDIPPESTDDTAVFYISTNGTLRALDGESWADLTENIPENTWLGFAVHLDYDKQTWDLYLSTDGVYGSPLTKANTNGPLAFSENAQPNFTNLIVQSGHAAYVDALAVSYAYDTSGGWATNSVTHTNVVAHHRLAGHLNPSGRPPYAYEAGDTDHLDSNIGADFAIGLEDDDRLRAYTNGWNVYEWNVDAWIKQSGLDPDALHVTASMGVQIERRYPADVVVFYPYGAAPAVTDQPIYGVDPDPGELKFGWNMLAWPWKARAANASGGVGGNWDGNGAWGFDDIVQTGDRIVVIENNVRRDFYWKNDRWYEGVSTASYVLKTGQGFWYYRAAASPAGDTEWPVSQVGD